MSSQLSNLVIDNGANTIKIGYAATNNTNTDQQPLIFPNMVCKSKGTPYIADQIESDLTEFSSLVYRRPYDRGYLIDCELEFVIWDHIFRSSSLQALSPSSSSVVRPSETRLIMSRQPFTPGTLQTDTEQLVFEHFGFAEYCSLSCAYFNFYNCFRDGQNESMQLIRDSASALIVDSGFSFTNVIPVVNHRIHPKGIKRLDIGGKALTNHLKEIVSLRYYDMRDETYLMNIVKEKMCFTSLDFMQELSATECDRRLQQSYVLPDYQTSMTGHVKKDNIFRKDEQTLTLNNERIAVPELLFCPSDIGMEQSGIPETICNSITTLGADEAAQAILFESIVLVGGNAKFKNFQKRIEQEVRQLAPAHMNVTVRTVPNPITNCWQGACKFATDESEQTRSQYTVTKAEYNEHGHNICLRKFIL